MRFIIFVFLFLCSCDDTLSQIAGIIATTSNNSASVLYDAESLQSEEFDSAPSTLTLTDPNSIDYVSDSRLGWTGISAGNFGFLGNTSYTRINGRAFRIAFARAFRFNVPFMGWAASFSSTQNSQFIGNDPMRFRSNAPSAGYFSIPYFSYPHDIWSVMRTNGHFLCTEDKLLFVSASGNTSNLKPCMFMSGSASTKYELSIDKFDVFNLTKASGGDWEDLLKTNVVASPTSGTTTTSEENAIIDLTWACVTAEVVDIEFRRIDSNNCWIARFNESTDRVYIYEKIAGVETERGATGGTAFTFNNGTSYQIQVIFDGPYIWTTVNGAKLGEYLTSTTNLTETGVRVSGFTTASNLITWKRDIDGLLPKSKTHTVRNIFFVGDSKTAGSLIDNAMANKTLWAFGDRDRGRFLEKPLRLATPGWTTNAVYLAIDAALAARTDEPEFVLYNLGANDFATMPTEANFKTQTLYIWDAIHTKWPNAKIYAAHAWRRTYETNITLIATWLTDCISQRSSFVFVGHDERVWMEGGDDGATMTVDGTHPSPEGQYVCAEQWLSVINP